jgi:hypothetical protein
MVSPIALDMPRMTAVETPDPAAGRTTLIKVCHRFAPTAYDASLKLFGTQLNASSARLHTVGTAITPSIMLAVKAHKPVGRCNNFCKKGAATTIPKKP